jgi:hypothetical protein
MSLRNISCVGARDGAACWSEGVNPTLCKARARVISCRAAACRRTCSRAVGAELVCVSQQHCGSLLRRPSSPLMAWPVGPMIRVGLQCCSAEFASSASRLLAGAYAPMSRAAQQHRRDGLQTGKQSCRVSRRIRHMERDEQSGFLLYREARQILTSAAHHHQLPSSWSRTLVICTNLPLNLRAQPARRSLRLVTVHWRQYDS